MREPENILRILESSIKCIGEEDTVKLKELSDHTIHSASAEQDPDNVAVAVIVYSLSKIIERGAFKDFPEFKKKTISLIKETISSIKAKDDTLTHKNLSETRELIEKFSGKLKEYIKDVFRKASINKASKIYEHGISQERTASLLGITMFELASYAGQKDIDGEEKTIDVKKRIKFAEAIFE